MKDEVKGRQKNDVQFFELIKLSCVTKLERFLLLSYIWFAYLQSIVSCFSLSKFLVNDTVIKIWNSICIICSAYLERCWLCCLINAYLGLLFDINLFRCLFRLIFDFSFSFGRLVILSFRLLFVFPVIRNVVMVLFGLYPRLLSVIVTNFSLPV